MVLLVLGSVAVIWNYAQTLVWSDHSTFSNVFRIFLSNFELAKMSAP